MRDGLSAHHTLSLSHTGAFEATRAQQRQYACEMRKIPNGKHNHPRTSRLIFQVLRVR